mmetsp:Transcript_14629/g.27467  ORF Transcript_14629/g.27467 Transcript_14629/m.27467 type:complete len:293 (+) Transcript_14629:74-952(+)
MFHELHGHGGSSAWLQPGPDALEVSVQLEPFHAQRATMQECAQMLSLFGEVAQLDLAQLRTAGIVRVRFFDVRVADLLRDYLQQHGGLGRLYPPSPEMPSQSSACREPGGVQMAPALDHVRMCPSEVDRGHLEIREERLLSGEETRCSLMIGHVPKNCDSVLFLQKLRDLGLLHRLRFFYMPIDKHRKRHFGYVFMELSEPRYVVELFRRLRELGESLGVSRLNRQLHIHFARLQGWRNFLQQYSDPDFIFEPNANVRPQLFLPHRSFHTADFHALLPSQTQRTYFQIERRV